MSLDMNVGQAIDLAKEWVETHGRHLPGFCGAHLMGGLNYAHKDAPFPVFKNVDVKILLNNGQAWDVKVVTYKGLILEYGTVDVESYRSPEAVLADPQLAPSLAVNSILSDPIGVLASLHASVAKEFARRKWVLARIAEAKNSARQSLNDLSLADSPSEAYFLLSLLLLELSGLLATSALRPPAHRRALILAGEILDAWGQAGLRAEMLRVYGCAYLDERKVEGQLQACAAAFDRAVVVTRTPIPDGAKLQAYVKPYFIEGAREMINEGHHREAVLWIAAGLLISNSAIQLDAPANEKTMFQMKVTQLAADLGLITTQDIGYRVQRASELTELIFEAAAAIAHQNPEIVE